jgi:hypothetical protein
MNAKNVLLIILLIVLLSYLKVRSNAAPSPTTNVDSTILYKPPWQGKVGDVVYWGGAYWGWTEFPDIKDWIIIGNEPVNS